MGDLTAILVPDIGEFTDVPVTEILVAVGATVAVEDPLVAIESDKATMEIPAPLAGVVREILVSPGDKVSEGTPIVMLAAGAGERANDTVEKAPSEDLQAPAQESPEPHEPTAQPPEETSRSNALDTARSDVYAGPVVRRMARERGIDLATVRGSGRRGRILIEDLDRAVETGAPGAAAGGDSLGLAPWPTVDFARYGELERIPVTRIQKLSGANLARNWVRIPHVTHNDDADITELEAFRKQLNTEQADVKVTMVALLLKAAAAALEAFPRFNASLDGDELVLKHYQHLGFAAETPQGLLVPVVRDVGRKGLLELAGEVSDLSQKARAGRIGPAEMSGATFTISSLGGIGGTSFTPIVNAPEVAILGVVRATIRPVWDGQQFQPRLILPLSLSYDHRVIDGAAAARFCAHLAGLLADMRRLLL